jgi:hypothetical protein
MLLTAEIAPEACKGFEILQKGCQAKGKGKRAEEHENPSIIQDGFFLLRYSASPV